MIKNAKINGSTTKMTGVGRKLEVQSTLHGAQTKLSINKFSKAVKRVETLKALLRKNVLNDVTVAPFFVSFSHLPTVKKTPKTLQL